MSHPVRRLAVLTLVPVALGGGLSACGGRDDTARTTTPQAPTGLADGATTPAGTIGGDDKAADMGDMAGMDHSGGSGGSGSGAGAGASSSGAGSSSGSGGASGSGASGSGDSTRNSHVDDAFLRQMIPHHQMAVQMGTMAVRQGSHIQVKQLAVKIITSQGAEIAAMEGYAKQGGISADGAGGKRGRDAKTLGLDEGDLGMSSSAMVSLTKEKPFDKEFLNQMITHHKGALAMAEAEKKHGSNPRVQRLAAQIVTEQKREIRQMRSWRKSWY